MIVLEVGTYQSDKMALPEDNNVLEQLAPAAADPAFSHGILLSRQLHPIGTIPHKYFRLLIPFIHTLARNIHWWSSDRIGAKIAPTITTLITVSGLSPLAGLALLQ